MFSHLLESTPQRHRRVGSTIFSIVFHSVCIAAAAWATANAAIEHETPQVEKITYVDVRKDDPPPPPKERLPEPPKDMTVVPPPAKGFQVLPTPVDIPKVIPDVDLNRQVTNEADFSGRGVQGGVARGVPGGTGSVGSNGPTYYEFQVEKPARQDPDSPKPQYPEILRSNGVEGVVEAEFVVDTSGRADAKTFKVLRSTNELFVTAVRTVLPRMRFLPAEVGGRKVRQLVQLPFSFAITH